MRKTFRLLPLLLNPSFTQSSKLRRTLWRWQKIASPNWIRKITLRLLPLLNPGFWALSSVELYSNGRNSLLWTRKTYATTKPGPQSSELRQTLLEMAANCLLDWIRNLFRPPPLLNPGSQPLEFHRASYRMGANRLLFELWKHSDMMIVLCPSHVHSTQIDILTDPRRHTLPDLKFQDIDTTL